MQNLKNFQVLKEERLALLKVLKAHQTNKGHLEKSHWVEIVDNFLKIISVPELYSDFFNNSLQQSSPFKMALEPNNKQIFFT